MSTRKRAVNGAKGVMLLGAILVLALGVLVDRAAGGAAEVVGYYRVASVTDLGTEVRLTLHLRLLNNTQRELSIIRMGPRVLAAGQRAADVAASLPLEPRESREIDQDFTLSRDAYRHLRKNSPIPLAVTYQSGTGRAVTRTIALFPEEAR